METTRHPTYMALSDDDVRTRLRDTLLDMVSELDADDLDSLDDDFSRLERLIAEHTIRMTGCAA